MSMIARLCLLLCLRVSVGLCVYVFVFISVKGCKSGSVCVLECLCLLLSECVCV